MNEELKELVECDQTPTGYVKGISNDYIGVEWCNNFYFASEMASKATIDKSALLKLNRSFYYINNGSLYYTYPVSTKDNTWIIKSARVRLTEDENAYFIDVELFNDIIHKDGVKRVYNVLD